MIPFLNDKIKYRSSFICRPQHYREVVLPLLKSPPAVLPEKLELTRILLLAAIDRQQTKMTLKRPTEKRRPNVRGKPPKRTKTETK